jgi:hypothetical protein
MGKYNITSFKKYKFDGSVHISYCDIGNNDCTAIDTPASVKAYFLFDGNNNAIQVNICDECKDVLSLLEKIG